MDGAEFEGGATHPIGKGGTVEIDALAAVDLGLPVECVFQAMVGSDSTGCRAGIPDDGGRGFRGMMGGRST